MKMADAASRQALEEGKKRLREFLESSDAGRQAMAMSANATGHSEEYEMESLKSRKKAADEGNDVDVDDI